MNTVSRTANADPQTAHRAARKAPTVVPFSRPSRNRSAGLPPARAATDCLLAAVG